MRTIVSRLIICMFCLCLLSCYHKPSRRTIETNNANIQCDFFKKRKINVGIVPYEKDTIITSFEYKNNTYENVYIDSVITSCGCISTRYPKKYIRPGEGGVIKVKIGLRKSESYIHKTIIVYVNNLKPIILFVIGKRK